MVVRMTMRMLVPLVPSPQIFVLQCPPTCTSCSDDAPHVHTIIPHGMVVSASTRASGNVCR